MSDETKDQAPQTVTEGTDPPVPTETDGAPVGDAPAPDEDKPVEDPAPADKKPRAPRKPKDQAPQTVTDPSGMIWPIPDGLTAEQVLLVRALEPVKGTATLTQPYGFEDDDGKAHFWAVGTVITDPAELAMLQDRKAPLE